jgi:hypothetical protein
MRAGSLKRSIILQPIFDLRSASKSEPEYAGLDGAAHAKPARRDALGDLGAPRVDDARTR